MTSKTGFKEINLMIGDNVTDWIDEFNEWLENNPQERVPFGQSMWGPANPFYGCKHTDESNSQMSESAKKRDNTKLMESITERWKSQEYKFLDPQGNLVVVNGSLNKWCKEMGLNNGAMSALHRTGGISWRGKMRSDNYKGWTKYG